MVLVRPVARSLGVAVLAECSSALTQKNLKAVFDTAIVVSLEHKEQLKGLRQRQREQTPNKITQLSQTWWRKLSCFV